MHAAALTALLAGVLGIACAEEVQTDPRELWSEEDVVSERTFLPGGMEIMWDAVGTALDTTLLNPIWLAAGPEGVTVWDEGRKAVVRISPEGAVLWRFGREGEGPGEFRRVRGIAHLAGGGAAAVDNINERLTIIDRDGQLAGETNLSGMSPENVASLSDGGFLVLTAAPGARGEPAFLRFDETGAVVDSLDFPWPPYREMSTIARQGRVFGVGAGWVFGFTAGNGWWRFGEDGAAEGFPYAEHADFPGLVTSVREETIDGRLATVRSTRSTVQLSTATGFGVRGDTVFVHFWGETDDRGRLLDLFSLADGSYYGSVRLPRWARAVAITPDAIYTLRADTFPMLTALGSSEGDSQAR